ncbi:MAG: DNA gyrase inhibitor YacG [Bryobacterales bacterium]|nr:DNA gyrase inhibitor YacG [Bryobacterales bacterium]
MAERKSIPCPVCKRPVYLGAEDFPFCSERCRLIDLGKWASEEYRIPGAAVDIDEEDSSETRPGEQRPRSRRKNE